MCLVCCCCMRVDRLAKKKSVCPCADVFSVRLCVRKWTHYANHRSAPTFNYSTLTISFDLVCPSIAWNKCTKNYNCEFSLAHPIDDIMAFLIFSNCIIYTLTRAVPITCVFCVCVCSGNFCSSRSVLPIDVAALRKHDIALLSWLVSRDLWQAATLFHLTFAFIFSPAHRATWLAFCSSRWFTPSVCWNAAHAMCDLTPKDANFVDKNTVSKENCRNHQIITLIFDFYIKNALGSRSGSFALPVCWSRFSTACSHLHL